MADTYAPIPLTPPGELLRDELEARGWGQQDFADITGRPVKTINEILKGAKQITTDTAIQFAEALGTSPQFWINLESNYRLAKSAAMDDGIARKAALYSRAPIRELVRKGWMKDVTSKSDVGSLEAAYCHYFEVDDVNQRPALAQAVAFRATDAASVEDGARLAWLYRAKHLAEGQTAVRFSARMLPELIASLKEIMVQGTEGTRSVPGLLTKFGIHLVLVSPLPKTRIDGAFFRLEDSPVVALSLRVDRLDTFWFTLMHELAHLACQHAMVVDEMENLADTDIEREANELACDWMIPRDKYEAFVGQGTFSKTAIRAFAANVGTHESVVVGRLKWDKHIDWPVHRSMHGKVRDVFADVLASGDMSLVA